MTTITTPFSGGCVCGAIRFESKAEPALMLHCHCRDCQQSSGGPFSSFVIVPTEAFKVSQGSLRFHDSPSHAGGNRPRAYIEHHADKWQPQTFVDCTFDQFRLAAKFGFDHDELDRCGEPAGAEPHQSTGCGHSFTDEQQRFLSSGNSLILKMKIPHNHSLEPRPGDRFNLQFDIVVPAWLSFGR